ncbi:MAG: hypothetical protein ACI9DC_002512 [Gammaproteobacteria bacterium]|jgi:hypothetical protein
MEASDLKQVRELESENAKLKRMYADLALESVAMKDFLKKTLAPGDKRAAAKYLAEQHGLAICRSCLCVALHRSTYYRVPAHWTVRDAPLIAALA